MRRDGRDDPTERLETGHPSIGPNEVAYAKSLPLWMDFIGVPNVGSDDPLEAVMAVEAASSLPHLKQPRPDDLGRRINRDRVCLLLGVGNKLVAGQRPAPLPCRRPPAVHFTAVRRSHRRRKAG